MNGSRRPLWTSQSQRLAQQIVQIIFDMRSSFIWNPEDGATHLSSAPWICDPAPQLPPTVHRTLRARPQRPRPPMRRRSVCLLPPALPCPSPHHPPPTFPSSRPLDCQALFSMAVMLIGSSPSATHLTDTDWFPLHFFSSVCQAPPLPPPPVPPGSAEPTILDFFFFHFSFPCHLSF